MALNKRIFGDYTIESVDGADNFVIKSQNITLQGLDRFIDDPDIDGVTNVVNTVTINGHLVVTGNTNTVSTTNTDIIDNFMTLNAGEGNSLTGVSTVMPGFDGAKSSGLIIDRGDNFNDVAIRFNEDADRWEATDDGTVWYPLDTSTAALDIINDTTPQLGGNLDVNGFSIVSVSNGDIVLSPNGTGEVVLEQNLKIVEQVGDETPEAGYNKVYAKDPGTDGGSGLYFANDTTADELVSARKARRYALIF